VIRVSYPRVGCDQSLISARGLRSESHIRAWVAIESRHDETCQVWSGRVPAWADGRVRAAGGGVV
jgi:hypothetical protein